MHRSNSRLLAGLILFVVGAAGFAYGLITYNAARASLAGRLNAAGNSIGNSLRQLFGAAPQPLGAGLTTDERTALIFLIAGGAVALIGLILLVLRRSRR